MRGVVTTFCTEDGNFNNPIFMLLIVVILFHGIFVPRTKSYFAPQMDKRTNLLNKFLAWSEINSYSRNEKTMERNESIPEFQKNLLNCFRGEII